jgi:HTH-type transcriptional regulator, sugar sensing transcriptional regulator
MRINWPDFALLDDAGLTSFEKRALVTLAVHEMADAATLCREGDIPTSKIYAATEKLAQAGLIELQRSRPRLFAALPPEQLVERLNVLARERAQQFVQQSDALRTALDKLPRRLKARNTRVDLAMGVETHVKRHLSRLAAATNTVLSYMESGDIAAITRGRELGYDLMRALAKHHERTALKHRVIFGFTHRSAPRLLEFLKVSAPHARWLSSVRYAGEIGHPFHVIDGRTVILALDHPFIGEGRFASLLIDDDALADELSTGFDKLWRKALADLREVRSWPGALRG